MDLSKNFLPSEHAHITSTQKRSTPKIAPRNSSCIPVMIRYKSNFVFVVWYYVLILTFFFLLPITRIIQYILFFLASFIQMTSNFGF